MKFPVSAYVRRGLLVGVALSGFSNVRSMDVLVLPEKETLTDFFVISGDGQSSQLASVPNFCEKEDQGYSDDFQPFENCQKLKLENLRIPLEHNDSKESITTLPGMGERREVEDFEKTNLPYRCIGKISISSGGVRFVGTGFLIAPRVFCTAATTYLILQREGWQRVFRFVLRQTV